jgi:hypothetical protein
MGRKGIHGPDRLSILCRQQFLDQRERPDSRVAGRRVGMNSTSGGSHTVQRNAWLRSHR